MFKTLRKFAGQGFLPLAGEILHKLSGLDISRFYDVKHQNINNVLGFDASTLDFQSFSEFISHFGSDDPEKRLLPISMREFLLDPVIKNAFSEEHSKALGRLFKSYGYDKSTKHNYYLAYQPILDFLLSFSDHISVVEIGIGSNNLDTLSNMGAAGLPGASLRAFRDYNANISVFGADVDKRILLSEERIKTYYVNQLQPDTINQLVAETCPDLLIDDGLHMFRPNMNVLNSFIAYAKDLPGKWFVIEDIGGDDQLIRSWLQTLASLEARLGFYVWLIKSQEAYIAVVCSSTS